MLAMLFIAERRAAHDDEVDLLTSRDIVEILSEILPRKAEGSAALVRRINQRHERRRGAIRSRYRDDPACITVIAHVGQDDMDEAYYYLYGSNSVKLA